MHERNFQRRFHRRRTRQRVRTETSSKIWKDRPISFDAIKRILEVDLPVIV